MADAERRTRMEMRAVEVTDGVKLALSEEETLTLWAILMKVGGSQDYSPRKHAKAMLEALAEATGRSVYGSDDDYLGVNELIERDHPEGHSIYFRDYPDAAE